MKKKTSIIYHTHFQKGVKSPAKHAMKNGDEPGQMLTGESLTVDEPRDTMSNEEPQEKLTGAGPLTGAKQGESLDSKEPNETLTGKECRSLRTGEVTIKKLISDFFLTLPNCTSNFYYFVSQGTIILRRCHIL